MTEDIDDSNDLDISEAPEYPPRSKAIMASFGSREMLSQWITAAFGMYVLFFYETVLGLNQFNYFIGFLIYSLWNAVNDPLMGYLSEKVKMPRGFKRFPWVLFAVVPWLFSYYAVFMVPLDLVGNQGLLLAWYTISMCIFDTLYTIMDVNSISLYPEKFRGLNERRTAQAFGTLLGILGLVLAFIIIPNFVTPGVPESYQTAALVSLVVGLLFFCLILPGVYEDKRLRAVYRYRERQRIKAGLVEEKPSFREGAKKVLKNKTFIIKIVFFFGYQASVALIQSSAPYITTFILDADSGVVTIIMAAMMLGALATVPLWLRISKRVKDNKKMSMWGAIFMLISYIPMIFVTDIIGWVVAIIIFGIGLGGQWFMDPPTMGDVLDDAAVKTGKREQALYYGYQSFFIRFGEAFKVAIFAIVHTLTGFIEGQETLTELVTASPTPELAIFGIRIHAAIVPAILILVSLLLFWKFYPLTPEKVAENRKKLQEMGI